MDKDISEKTRKITTIMITSSIIGLLLLSIFPLITVNESESVTYNAGLIEDSKDSNVIKVQNYLNNIKLLFWLVISSGLVSLIGLTMHNFRKRKLLIVGQGAMLVGSSSLIFSILLTLFHIDLILFIGNLKNISIALIGGIPIAYIHFPFLTGVISLVGSIFYIIFFTMFSIKNLKNDFRKQEEETSEEKSKDRDVEKLKRKEKESKEEKGILKTYPRSVKEKRAEIEEWFEKEKLKKEKLEKGEEKNMSNNKREKEEPQVTEEEEKDLFSKKINNKNSSKEENASKYFEEDSDEEKISPVLEEALSKVVEKKQKESVNKRSEGREETNKK